MLVQHPALFVGFVHGLAPHDALLQLAVGGGEFLGADSQRGFQPDEIDFHSPRGAMVFLNG